MRNPFRKRKEEVYEEEQINIIAAQHKAEYTETLTSYLEKVFYEKAYAEYGGGTLFVSQAMMTSEGKELVGGTETFWLNISDEKLAPDVRYWVCMCYLKYKGKTHAHYDEALAYVEEHTTTDDLAKRILEIV